MITEATAWARMGAPDPDRFITPGSTAVAQRVAGEFCARCSTRGECLEARQGRQGIWGGWLFPAQRYDGSSTEPVALLAVAS